MRNELRAGGQILLVIIILGFLPFARHSSAVTARNPFRVASSPVLVTSLVPLRHSPRPMVVPAWHHAGLSASPVSALVIHVIGIVSSGTDEEMAWSDAGRIVASVANIRSGRNLDTGKFKYKPVSVQGLSAYSELSVSITSPTASPEPAGIRLIGLSHFRPEAYINGDHSNHTPYFSTERIA